jgi:hypothetical protein
MLRCVRYVCCTFVYEVPGVFELVPLGILAPVLGFALISSYIKYVTKS